MHTPGTVGACVCVCGREPNPRGTRPGGPGPLPPEGRKWFDFDITGHQRRKHRLGFCRSQRPGAAPRIWLRLCEGYRLDPTDSSYDAEFWLPPRRGSTLVAPGGQCRCAHAAYLHSVVPVGGGVLFLLGKGGVGWQTGRGPQGTQEKGERLHVCFRIEPAARSALAGDMCAVCPRFSRFGGSWGPAGALLGRRMLLFHGSRRKSRQRGGNSSGGQEANLGGRGPLGGLGDTHALLFVCWVCVCALSLPLCACACDTAGTRRTCYY